MITSLKTTQYMLLYQPLQLKSVQLRNRLVMSPMCMYSATGGLSNDFHFVHYGSRAQGGVGLIMVESTGIVPEGRITPKCLGLWNDAQKEALQKITAFVHENSETKIGIQLSHAGRKASTWLGGQIDSAKGGWQTIAPSAIGFSPEDKLPRQLSLLEIKDLVQKFKEAIQRAVDANFDVIEIHGAHGYLIHQFLSPLSNTRQDEYGGSFENRIRFLLEIIDSTQPILGDKIPLFLRISATEHADGGWSLDDSIQLASILKTKNIDVIDVSSGGNIIDAKATLYTAQQIPLSEAIRKTGIKTGAVGGIENAVMAEEVLRQEKADLIFIGRALLRNPYLPILSAFESDSDCFFPTQYTRAKPLKQY